jgi:hypothetical protein
MSKKHHRRNETQPATRRYVLRVVQRARDDILSALIHATRAPETMDEYLARQIEPLPEERIERAVNG